MATTDLQTPALAAVAPALTIGAAPVVPRRQRQRCLDHHQRTLLGRASHDADDRVDLWHGLGHDQL